MNIALFVIAIVFLIGAVLTIIVGFTDNEDVTIVCAMLTIFVGSLLSILAIVQFGMGGSS